MQVLYMKPLVFQSKIKVMNHNNVSRHTVLTIQAATFKEPVDPRVVERVRELADSDITNPKEVQRLVDHFDRRELDIANVPHQETRRR